MTGNAVCRVLAVVAWMGGLSASAIAQDVAPARPFAIENVTVVDLGDAGALIPSQTVVVVGNEITVVRRSGRGIVPEGATVLDGTGKFLIPGLWEMHGHGLEHYGIDYDFGLEALGLFVVNGVTGLRDMGSSLGQFLAAKRRIASQALPAPRIVAAGPMLEWAPPGSAAAERFGFMTVMVDTLQKARRGVDALVAAGVDFLKVHNGLSRETYFGIVEQARRRQIEFAGHVPDDVTVIEASDAGQRSIEHLAPVIRFCVSEVTEGSQKRTVVDEDKCRRTFRRMAENGTFLTPTLVSTAPRLASSPSASETRLRHIKPTKRETFPDLPAAASPEAMQRHALHKRLTRMALDAGVAMLAGTDTGTPYRLPGWTTHEELALLVDAGLTPLQALQAATVHPARALHLDGMLGTIEPGKIADLLLIDGNPLEDIGNAAEIAAVAVDGRLFDRGAIAELRASIIAAASR